MRSMLMEETANVSETTPISISLKNKNFLIPRFLKFYQQLKDE